MRFVLRAAIAGCLALTACFAGSDEGLGESEHALGKANKVSINGDKVLVMNGKKLFPIGFGLAPSPDAKAPSGKDALAELRSAGATFLRTGPWGEDWRPAAFAKEEKWLDAAAKSGMCCWLYFKEAS